MKKKAKEQRNMTKCQNTFKSTWKERKKWNEMRVSVMKYTFVFVIILNEYSNNSQNKEMS